MKCMGKKVMAEKARLAEERRAKEHEEFLAKMTPEERRAYDEQQADRLRKAKKLLNFAVQIHDSQFAVRDKRR